ncbi:MAG TPA: MFS transporter [Terriglobia bacterium]|jgi:SHS family lactate transporter-like MFS transporter
MQVTKDQWGAFMAVFLGWIVDAFDFNILAFILIDIEKSFTVDRALAGALGTVTLIMRLVGGTAAGAAADKWGRKYPLMLSVLWFSLFAFLSGFSSSYAMLFGLRALFGIGMGGEWAAGMPLVFEHWPAKLRGTVSGLMLGGWYWGYLFAAITFQFVYPLFSGHPDLGWRVMFWMAIVPALFTFWIRSRVSESPVWLERQQLLKQAASTRAIDKVSVGRIFQRDLILTTLHTTAIIGSFMSVYYSVNFWYPTFLREAGRPTLPYLAAFNFGAIIGVAAWGRLSETRLGRRGAVTITIVVGMASLPLYLHATTSLTLGLGALLMGAFGMGIWGMAPAYTNERFPTAVRGVGPGFCYHAGAAIGALMPLVLGRLQDRGLRLTTAMSLAMLVSGVLSATLIWLGPETRGREFSADDN